MADLFKIAADNAVALEGQFAGITSGLSIAEAKQLGRFAERIQQEGQVSINMKPSDLNGFLSIGTYQNTHEWANAMAGLSGRPAAEILKEKLGSLYPKRMAFDRHFDQGRQFCYGALYLVGVGVTHYGDYCVVLSDRLFSGRREIAYLRSDSLFTYTRTETEVDEEAVQREAAPHSHKHLLAAIKHAVEICRCAETAWPGILCSNSGYIEAIFVAQTTPSSVEVVRIARQRYYELFHEAFDDFRRRFNDERRQLVDTFVLILRLLKNNHIPLEIADA